MRHRSMDPGGRLPLDFARVMDEVGAKAALSDMISIKIAEPDAVADSDA